MKKFIIFLAFIAVALIVNGCKKEQPAPEVIEEPVVEVYKPIHQSTTVDPYSAKKYAYFAAPVNEAATSVTISYDHKTPYAQPIVIVYTYENGDTYTYTIPKDFGLWANERGRLRVVLDNENTVWLQGQTKKGHFHEFIFYGNPKFNGKKIKPNSYTNHPHGSIKYVN
jgi:hypothetical protein